MANFMGPMAPPQAAPQTPPQLDIRTNPGQRAQFKEFMQGMSRPAAPPTTAPIAPMLPAPMPSPMDQIDIFAPAPMANGGVVGGLQSLGEMSGQMVDALNTVVYGGSQGGGMPSSGGVGGPMSSGGGFGGGQMPAPLPPITNDGRRILPPGATPPALLPSAPMPISAAPQLPDRLSLNDMSLLGMGTPAYMPMDPDGDGVDQFNRPMESQLTDEQRTQAEQDQQERLKNLRSRFAEDSAFGSGSMGSPFSRLGVMGGLGSIFGYKDGGPVRMQRGGSTFRTGSDGRTVISSDNIVREDGLTDRERAAFSGVPSGVSGDDPYDEFSGGSDSTVFTGGVGTGDSGGASINVRPTGEIIIARDQSPKLGDMSSVELFDTLDPVTQAAIMNPPADSMIAPVGSMDNLIARNQQTQQGFQNLLTSMGDIDESAGDFAGISPVASVDPLLSGPQDSGPSLLDLMDPGNVPNPFLDAVIGFDRKQRDALSEVESLIGPQPRNVGPVDSTIIDFINRNPQPPADSGVRVSPPPPAGMPGASPMTDLLAGEPGTSGAGDDSLTGRLGQLMAGDVVYNRGKGNERTVNRLRDLENRMGVKRAFGQQGGLGALAEPIVSKIASATGGAMATNIFDNVVNQNKQPIIAADTNQIVGYADDGPFGRVYTGRPGYNPFGADGSSYTVDPQTGALIVNRKQENQGEDDQQRNRASSTLPPATDPADTTPPPVTPPTTGLPPAMPDPMNVVVPSTRVADPLGLTPPAFAPVQSVGLPQSFLDLLASFNRPAPRAMQDGGAVLDQAAGNFLEALKVA